MKLFVITYIRTTKSSSSLQRKYIKALSEFVAEDIFKEDMKSKGEEVEIKKIQEI
jgi:hypothetical protein